MASTVLDPDTGKIVTTFPIGEGVDAIWFDAANRNVLASSSDETLGRGDSGPGFARWQRARLVPA